MLNDTIIKAFLASFSSYLFYKAFRPPHAAMDASQRDKNVKNPMETKWGTQYLVIMKAHAQLTLGFIEVAALISKANPSSPFALLANSLFIFATGDPTRLYLSQAHIIGGIMMIVGGAIRVWAIITLGNFFRFQVGIQQNHKLITTGPYSIVRHPSYMGMQLTHAGSLLWHLSPGSWIRESGVLDTMLGRLLALSYFGFIVSAFFMITIVRMRKEDKVIQRAFGKEWEDWAKAVPWRVVPGVY